MNLVIGCPSMERKYYPDTTSCFTYYECLDGIPVKRQCPLQRVFNPIVGYCDFPTIFGCTPLGSSLYK